MGVKNTADNRIASGRNSPHYTGCRLCPPHKGENTGRRPRSDKYKNHRRNAHK